MRLRSSGGKFIGCERKSKGLAEGIEIPWTIPLPAIVSPAAPVIFKKSLLFFFIQLNLIIVIQKRDEGMNVSIL